ncbi:hypothetical protein PBT90_19570 [Algoriphagus halophytocola]|uniref:Uncharacterized protein n=1 Tax=Algoriphagus halophytocola TaxID=2991499 RepID=A0ABY6MHD5_9BACT|nr:MULTISPECIES: hypothetical protein [unclassified Algoriphagus]UZD21716.1 hypothetical protein OM944_13705 [Algoriphagus sp. TR-M5]WBL42928.1 hypothetical protein PBT90_19570 [Algoriphagus sp. TR-M9]
MSIIYTRLGEVALRHDFYKDGIAKGISLHPSAETAHLLKNGRILFKTTPGGAVLLYRAEEDESTPISPLKVPLSFFFYLYPENIGSFYQITDLDEGSKKYESGKIPFFFNIPNQASTDSASPEILSYRLLDGARRKVFSLDVKLNPEPASVRLKVRNSKGEVISAAKSSTGEWLPDLAEILPDSQGNFRFVFDLSGKAEGLYTITLRDEADSTDLWSKAYFLADDFPSSCIGLFEIKYDTAPAHLYGPKEYYQLNFTSLESLWTYFIVNGNQKIDLVTNNLSIEDDGNEGTVPYGTYNFNQIGASPNVNIKLNGKETVVFRSESKIPFFEIPKLNLKLVKSPGNQVLIPNLPNPSRSAATKDSEGDINTEIYVYI